MSRRGSSSLDSCWAQIAWNNFLVKSRRGSLLYEIDQAQGMEWPLCQSRDLVIMRWRARRPVVDVAARETPCGYV